jgi:hypothetical protein
MTCRHSERWVFTLDQEFTWQSGFPVSKDLAFRDKKGVIRLILRQPDLITVTKDYAWDGCTPKFCFLDVNFGTPDGVIDSRTKQPKTYYASLVTTRCISSCWTGCRSVARRPTPLSDASWPRRASR